jgi:hypothetical protein
MTRLKNIVIMVGMILWKALFLAGTRSLAAAMFLLVLVAQASGAEAVSRRLDSGWEFDQDGLAITQPLLWLKNEY